jgi:FAD/FMN-containing dehydrogenase
VAALSEIGRSGLAGEAYVWDPSFVKVMSGASTGARQDLAFLWAVVCNASGPIDGLRAALRIMMSGRRVFRPATHLLQVTMDDHNAAGAAARLAQIRGIALRHGAAELAPSVPRALRAMPFTNFNVPERRTSERNLPTNSLYPHSRAAAANQAINKLFERHADDMARQNVRVGTVFFAVGRSALCIEPLIYWDDDAYLAHDRIAETSDLARLPDRPEGGETATYVHSLREELKLVMEQHGAVHVQIGKSYNFIGTREPRVAELLRGLKALVDPAGLVNPGSLGLADAGAH